MLRLVIFDWDGTLADSINCIVRCKEYLADKHRLPTPHRSISRKVIGLGFDQAMKACFPSANKYQLQQLKSDFHEEMNKPRFQAKLFPDAICVLKQLKSKNLLLAISTSKDRAQLESASSYRKVGKFFDMVCCADEFASKPDPKMLLHILHSLCVCSSEALMVGDTTVDIQLANNANMSVVAISSGAHTASELELLSPNWLIDDISKLDLLITHQFDRAEMDCNQG